MQCRRCDEAKTADQMKRDARNKSGFSSYCKDCHKAASIAWQKAHPDRLNATRRQRYQRNSSQINASRRASYDYEKERWAALQYRYGVTREWYEAKLAEQDGKCALCRRAASTFERPLAVDHDHGCCPDTPTCGHCARGLLCASCNGALHAIERDPQWLHNVFAYLHMGGKTE